MVIGNSTTYYSQVKYKNNVVKQYDISGEVRLSCNKNLVTV